MTSLRSNHLGTNPESGDLRDTAAGDAKRRFDTIAAKEGKAEIAGFELGISGDDVTVALGFIDGVAVDAVTLDVSALGLGDGTHAIVFDGSTVTAEAQPVSGNNVQLGTFTESSAAASAVSFEGRGKRGQVSPSI